MFGGGALFKFSRLVFICNGIHNNNIQASIFVCELLLVFNIKMCIVTVINVDPCLKLCHAVCHAGFLNLGEKVLEFDVEDGMGTL